MTVKERLLLYIEKKGLKKGEFFDSIGIAASAFRGEALQNNNIGGNNLVRLLTLCGDISADWLLTGCGPMLKNENTVSDEEVPYVPDTEIVNIPTPPIISASLAKTPNVDIWDVVKQQAADMVACPVKIDELPISFWHRMRDNSLEPEYHLNDNLAMLAYPQGRENPIPGNLYGVDTVTNGLIVRRLYAHPDGFLGRSYDPESYPDIIFRRGDVIRIYRVLFMGRSL